MSRPMQVTARSCVRDASSQKIQIRNLLCAPADNRYVRVGRPKHLRSAPLPAEVFQLLEALESAAEAVGVRLRADAKVPAWRDELARSVARLYQLILVSGESGAPSLLSRIMRLEDRVAELEALASTESASIDRAPASSRDCATAAARACAPASEPPARPRRRR